LTIRRQLRRPKRKFEIVKPTRTHLAPSTRQFEEICTADELLPLARAYASDHRGFREMSKLLLTQDYQSMSFGKLIDLLAETGVAFTELALTYQNFQHAKAGIIRSYFMPNIMKELSEDAMDGVRKCPKCKGKGSIADQVCPRCNSTGKIDRHASRHARKMILEAAGLVGGKGPMVNVNVPITLPSPEEAMIGASKIINAQPVEVMDEIPSLPPAPAGETTGEDSERA